MNIIEHSQKVISSVRKKTNRAILFYSTGKDSIALLDMMAKEFDEVVLVFMYFVKGLEHVDIYLKDALKRYPNVKVIQKPHWNLTHVHRNGMYCIANPNIKLKTVKDIDTEVRLQTGIEWTFYGMKKADSLQRRIMMMGYEDEAVNEKTQKVYPLSRWKNGEVLRYIKDNALPSPTIYGKKASNGIGFNLDCLLWMREHYPQDLKRFEQEFPMSKVILWKYDRENNLS